MKLSKALAFLSWLNTFALMWVMIFDLTPGDSRWVASTSLIAFIAFSCVVSSIQAQDKKFER